MLVRPKDCRSRRTENDLERLGYVLLNVPGGGNRRFFGKALAEEHFASIYTQEDSNRKSYIQSYFGPLNKVRNYFEGTKLERLAHGKD